MQATSLAAAGRRALLADWWLVLAAAMVLTGIAVQGYWAARLDAAAYDLAARRRAEAPRSPVQSLIVAIDDRSLAQVGPWPWPREVQAELVTRLAVARPAALGLDLIFAEPRPGDDAMAAALQQARAAGIPAVLPVSFDVPGPDGVPFAANPPLPAFAGAPGSVGHVNLATDPDGVIRRVWRRYVGAGRSWDALPAVMLGHDAPPLPAASTAAPTGPALTGSQPLLIDWRGPPGAIPRVSASAILAGTVPPDLIAGRPVLVGVTAAGLGDNHAVPVGGGALMPGVEIQANLLETLRDPAALRDAGSEAALALALIPLILMFLAVRRLPAGWTALAALLLIATVVAVSAALWARGLWLSPVTAVLALVLSWPVWAWARLVVTGRYVSRELERAAADAGTPAPVAASGASLLDRQLALLEASTMRERLLRAEHDEVIRLLSHDMRAPQAAILALTEGSDDVALPPDLVARVRAQARRTLDLSDGFLHLSRAQLLEWEPQLLDLAELARDAADALWANARERGMTVEVEVEVEADRAAFGEGDAQAEVLVMGEPSLLARMIANLAGNAVKYGAAQTAVRVIVRKAEGRAEVAVCNVGPPIPPERIGTLFDRFSRAVGGASRTDGAGLGLAFVQTVAERHGGTVCCRSNPDETRFTVRLPLAAQTP